jgi:hypothetical protein
VYAETEKVGFSMDQLGLLLCNKIYLNSQVPVSEKYYWTNISTTRDNKCFIFLLYLNIRYPTVSVAQENIYGYNSIHLSQDKGLAVLMLTISI